VVRPLIHPFKTAFADIHSVESIFVRLESERVAGWGEAGALPAPSYNGEWGASIYMLCRDWMAPLLMGKDISSSEELQALLSPFRENRLAKAAFDFAWWDLYA
jgi:O-succinylbenzoate synthase